MASRQYSSLKWPLLAAGLLVSTVAAAVGFAQKRAARPPAGPASAAAPSSTATAEPQTRQKPMTTEERLEVLRRAFEKENVDPAWGAHASQLLRDEYAKDPLKGLTASVECRTTLCRVDSSYTDPIAGLDAERALNARRAWPAPALTHVDTVAQRGVTYVPREGHDLL